MSFAWLTENSRKFLESGYLAEGLSPEVRIREIADAAEKILEKKGFADKFYGYMEEGYYALSSPVWSNFGNHRGLPISCFGSCIADDMGDILYTQAEVGMMSKLGGGTSAYFGNLRPRGAKIRDTWISSGAVHFMQLFENVISVVSQGSLRRGHLAAYLPIDHGDAEEFLDIATEGNSIQRLTHAVTVKSDWMESMIDGDDAKRKLWAKVIQRRGEIGYPYVMFTDNANDNTVDVYKDKKLEILASNMCSEIMLPSNNRWSFVCCLSSMNLATYDQWRDTDAVEVMVQFLDAVMEEFITKLEVYRDSDRKDDQQLFEFMKKSYTFAKENRALGVGTLGWHSLLQSKKLPFDGDESHKLNAEIFKLIKERSYKASEELAKEFGEPEILKGYGRRNTTLMAIAPNTSSAFILGQVSQGIEPFWSNCYVKDVAKLKVTVKNQYLEELLEEKGINNREIWTGIRDNDGSVQHLTEELSDDERERFKTFAEIDQYAIIEQAAVRQHYIDQGQSLNIMINPKTPVKEINNLYIHAWKLGIKALYYQHSMNAAQELNRKKSQQDDVCIACD